MKQAGDFWFDDDGLKMIITEVVITDDSMEIVISKPDETQ